MGCWNPVGYAALNVLLVGPKRTGKSSTGNTLLGQGHVFDIRGGGTSTGASSVTAGRHVTVVDAQGWSSSEEPVPREEKIQLMRALDMCEPAGPHCVLLVIPLLDFTEAERRAVEKRMELFTFGIWRHTMVLFTFGDRLRASGLNIREHIQSGGPALHWLIEKCRYRYHVFDNKKANGNQHVGKKVKDCEGNWWRTDEKGGRGNRESEADERQDVGQEQVRELLSKVEDMLQENGGWHFSLHMYRRIEEELNRREQQLIAQLEMKIYMKKMLVERLETKEEEEGSPRSGEGEGVERKINRDEEEKTKEELQRQISQEEGYDTSSESEREKDEERGVMTERGKKGTEIKS